LTNHPCKTLLVRGLPGNEGPMPPLPPHVTAVNHLPTAELSQALQQTDWVVCRSGYTTVMDLVQLGKKAILVPTPGQTEQEYLGRYLQQQGLFYSVPQHLFNLPTDLEKAKPYSLAGFVLETEHYQKIVAKWVQSLLAHQAV
jgi:UDP-N-acetylglucosamine:LPS N-acetylglucosamine transferase